MVSGYAFWFYKDKTDYFGQLVLIKKYRTFILKIRYRL